MTTSQCYIEGDPQGTQAFQMLVTNGHITMAVKHFLYGYYEGVETGLRLPQIIEVVLHAGTQPSPCQRVVSTWSQPG